MKFHSFLRLAAGVLLLSGTAAGLSRAQPAALPPLPLSPPPPPVALPVEPGSVSPSPPKPGGGEGDGKPADALRVERRVFVPFEDLEKAMRDQGQGVFLPYREFLEMWNQLLAGKEKEKESPPADGLVASAVFTGKIEGDTAVVEAVLQVESFKEGWSVLPLGGKDLNVAQAETGAATLRRGENGMEALLPQKGKYELKLRIFTPVERGAGRQSLTLTLPKTPVSRLDLTLPDTGWELSTEPVTAFTTQPSDDGKDTRVSVFFGDRDRMALTWQKTGGAARLTPLIFADTRTECMVAPGALHTEVTVDYSILRAGVSEFEIAVPVPNEVLSVNAENIREWTVEKSPDGKAPQVLKVSLHAAAREHFRLKLDLESPLEHLPVSPQAPVFETRGVLRQSGHVVIRSSGELDTEVRETSGLTQQAMGAGAVDSPAAGPAAPAAAPAGIAASALGNWRYLKLPWALTLAVKKAEPVVEADSFTEFRVQPDLLTFDAGFTWTVKRAGVFEARVIVPAGWDHVEATGEAVEGSGEETTGEGAGLRRTLTVRFKNRQEGAVAFRITGRQLRAGAETEAAVPVFLPVGVSRHDALIGVTVDGTLDANTRDPGGLKQEDVARLAEKAPKPAEAFKTEGPGAAGGSPWTIGFRYRGEAAPAVLTFKTKKPQVSGEVLTLTEIRDQSVSHHWWLRWDILYSGVDTFYLSVPKDIADDIRVETPAVKEVDKKWIPAAGADPARQYWRLVSRDKVPGKFEVELSYESPLGTLESGKNTKVAVPEVALLDLFQETGQMAVIKSGSLEVLDPEASAALEPADPRELEDCLRKPGVFLAWKWKKHPAAVTLPVSRNELIGVPQAIVTYADLTTVMTTDQSQTTEVVYHVRNNTQQYFTVTLPQGGRMLSEVTVAGRAQQPQHRVDREGLLIRLPVDQGKQSSFAVRFVFEAPPPFKTAGALGDSGFASVEVPGLEDADILESQLRLFLPSGISWLNFDSAMRRPPEDRGWAVYGRPLGWLIPALGPQLTYSSRENPWTSPPVLTPDQRGALEFQIPKDGQEFLLHRLAEPSPVMLSYRSSRWEHTVQALGLMLGFGVGFLIRKRSAGLRMGYVLFVGLGALVLEGALPPGASAFLHFLAAGVMLAAVFWILRAVVKTVLSAKLQPGGSGVSDRSKPQPKVPAKAAAESREDGNAPPGLVPEAGADGKPSASASVADPSAGSDSEPLSTDGKQPPTPPQP